MGLSIGSAKFIKLNSYLEAHILPISIILMSLILFFIYYSPVYFGMSLLIFVFIFLIGFFNLTHVKKSLISFFVMLVFLSIIISPMVISIGINSYRINNPDTIIDLNNPTILKMTSEFKDSYKGDFDDIDNLLFELEKYVKNEKPYGYGNLLIFPSTQEVLDAENADCRGWGIIGFSILKNLGYNAYILYGVADGPHAWIRVVGNDGTYKQGFLLNDNRPNSEPYLILNEEASTWNAPLSHLMGVFLQGFYHFNIQATLFLATLILIIPIIALMVYLLLINKIKSISFYVSVFLFALIVVYLSANMFIDGREFNILPVIVISGIYLRIVNILVSKESLVLVYFKNIYRKPVKRYVYYMKSLNWKN